MCADKKDLCIVINVNRHIGIKIIEYIISNFSFNDYKYEIVAVTSKGFLNRHIKDFDKLKRYDNILVVVLSNDEGLSYGRNVGFLKCRSRYVAFIDDDAIPSKNWINLIIENLKDFDGVVGGVEPIFLSKGYSIIPEELYRLISCTGEFMPPQRKVHYAGFGVNMSFRTDVLNNVKGFNTKLGVSSKKKCWIGGEDTEFILRLKLKGYTILWDPRLKVYHIIHPNRCTIKYLISRAYNVGRTASTIRFLGREYRQLLIESEGYNYLRYLLKKTVCRLSRLEIRKAIIDLVVLFFMLLGYIRGPHKEVLS